ALGEVTAPKIAAAHVNADGHVGRPVRDRLVDRLDVELDERIGIAAGSSDLFADYGIAQHRDRDLVELDVAASGGGERGDLLGIGFCEIGEERGCVRIDPGRTKVGAAVEV